MSGFKHPGKNPVASSLVDSWNWWLKKGKYSELISPINTEGFTPL